MYCSRYKSQLKARAVEMLNRHLADNHCPTAVMETLSIDDYSISFELATLSCEGKEITGGKPGPLSFCHCPGFIQPKLVASDVNFAGDHDYAHVVNAYFHIIESGKRREPTRRKAIELLTTGSKNNYKRNRPGEYRSNYQQNYQQSQQAPTTLESTLLPTFVQKQ